MIVFCRLIGLLYKRRTTIQLSGNPCEGWDWRGPKTKAFSHISSCRCFVGIATEIGLFWEVVARIRRRPGCHMLPLSGDDRSRRWKSSYHPLGRWPPLEGGSTHMALGAHWFWWLLGWYGLYDLYVYAMFILSNMKKQKRTPPRSKLFPSRCA